MADVQSALSELEEAGVRVAAASADGARDAADMVERLGLTFPILHGLDVGKTVRALGCYSGTRKGAAHLQPAAFVLSRDGVVRLVVYSSGRVGRLSADDMLSLADG